jgi:hypothetical protein
MKTDSFIFGFGAGVFAYAAMSKLISIASKRKAKKNIESMESMLVEKNADKSVERIESVPEVEF